MIDSPQAEAVQVLARAHQSLIWTRARQWAMLRANLLQYYPAALEALPSLGDRDRDRDALTVLGRAPTPDQGARLSLSKIGSALKAGGRQRNIDQRARQIHAALRTEQLAAPEALTHAYGAITVATVHLLIELTDRATATSPPASWYCKAATTNLSPETRGERSGRPAKPGAHPQSRFSAQAGPVSAAWARNCRRRRADLPVAPAVWHHRD